MTLAPRRVLLASLVPAANNSSPLLFLFDDTTPSAAGLRSLALAEDANCGGALVGRQTKVALHSLDLSAKQPKDVVESGLGPAGD